MKAVAFGAIVGGVLAMLVADIPLKDVVCGALLSFSIVMAIHEHRLHMEENGKGAT